MPMPMSDMYRFSTLTCLVLNLSHSALHYLAHKYLYDFSGDVINMLSWLLLFPLYKIVNADSKCSTLCLCELCRDGSWLQYYPGCVYIWHIELWLGILNKRSVLLGQQHAVLSYRGQECILRVLIFFIICACCHSGGLDYWRRRVLYALG